MQAPGKLVPVNDTQMHVYPMLGGAQSGTIVFLAGSGTECPTYDFKPLWHLLAGRYSMAVVERPGYGWSGATSRPRDIDTVLEETRTALRLAGIPGPYIPAAHSMAGLEALYWAQQYPEEVAAIIGLDMAVPQVYDTLKLPPLFGLQVRLAHRLRRPIAKAMVKSHPAVTSGLLDAQEQAAMWQIVAKQLLSQNMVDEIQYVSENAKKVAQAGCPVVPVLCLLAHDKANTKRIPTWGKAHRETFSGNSRAQFVDLDCGHYVHREAPKPIADRIALFFAQALP